MTVEEQKILAALKSKGYAQFQPMNGELESVEQGLTMRRPEIRSIKGSGDFTGVVFFYVPEGIEPLLKILLAEERRCESLLSVYHGFIKDTQISISTLVKDQKQIRRTEVAGK